MPTPDNSASESDRTFQRRTALALLGMGGFAWANKTALAMSASEASSSETDQPFYSLPTVADMKQRNDLKRDTIICTLGYFAPGDGGSAFYVVKEADKDRSANDGDVIALKNDLQACLLPDGPINYHMFGAKADGTSDDGVQIKRAHVFAEKHQIPVIHRSGEFWIEKTNSIPITTNVDWGNTIFHINEKFNEKAKPRFVIKSGSPGKRIDLDDSQKASLLKKLRPGVAAISELAPYKNCLVSVVDKNDQIGFRAGSKYKGQSWNREELFYVEQDGRIVGDIAWEFKDYTSLTAYPCDDSYLTIEGGGFYLSGDVPGDTYNGYYSNGFRVERSRTIIRNQWMGLEPGQRDTSMQPRSGFYSLSRVYDTVLENIRLIPWEQNRSDPKKRVAAGTYGISGGRMLNCTFRNLTAEGTWLHWGVFGTNINKNFRIENCRLNRVDVHFHCWNLTIQDSIIGMRGISVTGGGTLNVENTVEHSNSLINLRRDFGAKWDGDIHIRNCRLVPPHDRPATVVYCHPSQFDYGYPIGCARTITIENLVVDYSNFPESSSLVWLLNLPAMKDTEENQSGTFFPHLIAVRNVSVRGRSQGVRLINVPDPYGYTLSQKGDFNGDLLQANCQMVFENIQLEDIAESAPDHPDSAHLRLGNTGETKYAEDRGLYPRIRITECSPLSMYLGGSAASVSISNCQIDRLTASQTGPLKGKLVLDNCSLRPKVEKGTSPIYALDAELGTHFTNCTIHPPIVEGKSDPDDFDRIDFVQMNKIVRYFHANTTLSNEMLRDLKNKKQMLEPGFIAMLKSHHALEPDKLA